MKTCVICGKEFEPRHNLKERQKCCSAECSAVLKKQIGHIYRETHQSEIRAKRKKMRVQHLRDCRCWICGQHIDKPITGERVSNIRMHDECVYRDAVNTLNSGGQLSDKQKLRLYARGWTVTEFKEEVRKGRLDEIKG